MSFTAKESPPRGFWIIAILALLWNLTGVVAYIMDVTMSPEALAALPSAEQALFASVPAWATGAYAIGVFGGLLGCAGLLLRKKWATPLFVISLVGVLVQFLHGFFMTEALEVYGRTAIILPLSVVAVAGFLIWYSKNATAKEWLS